MMRVRAAGDGCCTPSSNGTYQTRRTAIQTIRSASIQRRLTVQFLPTACGYSSLLNPRSDGPRFFFPRRINLGAMMPKMIPSTMKIPNTSSIAVPQVTWAAPLQGSDVVLSGADPAAPGMGVLHVVCPAVWRGRRARPRAVCEGGDAGGSACARPFVVRRDDNDYGERPGRRRAR